MNIQERINEYLERYQGLEQRERVLVAGVCLVVIYFLMDFLLVQPVMAERKELQADIVAAEKKHASITTEIATLTTQLSTNPVITLNRQVESLQRQIAEQDESVQARTAGLTPAAELPLLLEDIIPQHTGLIFSELQTLPVEELRIELPGDSARAGDDVGGSGVFKHSFELSVKGGYLPLYNFLKSLEQLPWGIYWQELGYDSAKYPNADIRLLVYTLSTEGGAFAE